MKYPSNGDKSSLLKQDIFGWTPIHYLAASGQHTTDLPWYLKDGVQAKSQDQFGFTPLHYACFRKDETMLQVLLDNDAPIETQQLDGISPLHIAAIQSDAKTLDLILRTAQARADKKLREMYSETSKHEPLTSVVGRLTDFDDRAAVHWAAIYGNIDAIKLLKQNLNLQDRYGWNCLHLAVMHENIKLVEYLITEGGLDVNAKGNDGLTPLHLAIRKKQTAIIGLLINKHASINTMATNGDMPFHQAVDRCELSVIKSLIENGAKINIQEHSAHCWNPLHYATRRGNLNILERLLETDEGQKASRVKSKYASTPLHNIAHWRHKTAPEMARMISKYLEGDVNPQDSRGETPLHNAVERANAALTRTLLDIGATDSLFISNIWQQTPLDLAKAQFQKQKDGKLAWHEKGKDWSEVVAILENYEAMQKQDKLQHAGILRPE